MRRSLVIYISIALIGMGIGGFWIWNDYQEKPNFQHAAVAGGSGDLPPSRNTFVVGAVKKASPSVVGITNKAYARDIFNRKVRVGEGVGSGVIFDAKGYIVTNYHVIADSAELIVSLADGRTFPAILVGSDPLTDLAVVKIEADQLIAATFGDSDRIQVGEPAIAIGNPLGVEFRGSVTSGDISGLGRTIKIEEQQFNLIQTDAAINPGNSGGALIDVAGNLIGVNTAIFSRTGGSLGIGFAIPAQICQQVLDSILQEGRVVRGWLGISLLPVEQVNILEPKGPGVVVADVLKTGPAAKAGLKKGDKIVKVNDEVITSTSHLINFVALQPPNSTIQISLERDGKSLDVAVVVGERKAQNQDSQFIPLPE